MISDGIRLRDPDIRPVFCVQLSVTESHQN